MLKILVVSHDAGGANILSSLIKKYYHSFEWKFCTTGPAKKIFFNKKIGSHAKQINLKNSNIDNLLNSTQFDLVLTGTGWQSDFEIDFLTVAKEHKIKTASFLDHWCNYRERFGYPGNWKKNLPNFILVSDQWAYRVARDNGFPKKKLFKVENPYLEGIIEEAKKIKRKKTKEEKTNTIKILYLSEPIYKYGQEHYNNPNYLGYTEYEVFKDLLKVIRQHREKTPMRLRVRLHPAEKINKYSHLIKNQKDFSLKKFTSVSNPTNNSLVNDCLWADIVIGSETMALVVALIVGKKAMSYIPSGKKRCSLPHKRIKRVHSTGELSAIIELFKKKNDPRMEKCERVVKENLFETTINKILCSKI